MNEFETYGMPQKMPLWAKALGTRYWCGDGTARTKIGEVTIGGGKFAFKAVCYSSPSLMIGTGLFLWFMPLPRWTLRFLGTGDCDMENPQYGWSTDESGVHLSWGNKSTILWWPWMLEHIRTDYLGIDLKWYDARAHPERDWARRHPDKRHRYTGPIGPEAWSETHPYRYMLQSGEVQLVQATITRRRAYHGRNWFGPQAFRRWLRSIMPKHMFDSIDIEFSGEVGERAGSWKGGVIGCSYDIKPNESPKAALMRMQSERRFRR